MKTLVLCGLTLVCLSSPPWAQPATGDSGSIQQTQDLLLQYGSCLRVVNERYHVVRRMTDLVTPDQMDALNKLRISPDQAKELAKLVRDNLPEGPLDDKAWKELRRRITPRAEDILGSEQYDRLLELMPSPQQKEKIEAILQDAAATPEGKQALAAAQRLEASLSTEQRRFLEPLLGVMKNPRPKTTLPSPVLAKKPTKVPPGQRRLVYLRKTLLGETYGEVRPENNFTEYFPQRFRILATDPEILSNLSNSSGLPVRVLGDLQGDRLTVASGGFSAAPALMPVSGDARVWRGRLPARLLSSNPPVVELDSGGGQLIQGQLEFTTSQEKNDFDRLAPAGKFLLGTTAITRASGTTLVDLDFFPWQEPNLNFSSGILLQLSEEFLQHAAEEVRQGRPDLMGGSSGQVSVQVSQLGVTLQGCSMGQVRLYGRLTLAHSGLTVLEVCFETVAAATFQQGKLQLTPVPKSLQGHLSYPLYARAPAAWTENLERVLGAEYARGVSLAVTAPHRDQLLKSDLVDANQLDGMQFFSWPGGDRRTSLVSLASPAQATPPSCVLRSRLEVPGEWTVAVSEESINNAIRKKLPTSLPIKRPVPKDVQKQGGVTLTEMEVPELDISFQNGRFQIHNCVVNFHWSSGLFSGVEPGARFKATARLSGEGNPLKLRAHLKIESLDLLSKRILDAPPEEQRSQKEDLIKAFEDHPLELGDLSQLSAEFLSPRAALVPTAVSSRETPSELLLHGRLQP